MERWEESEQQVTTKVPGQNGTEPLAGGPGHLTDPLPGDTEATPKVAERKSGRLPVVMAAAAATAPRERTEDATKKASAATGTATGGTTTGKSGGTGASGGTDLVGRRATPTWQRSHPVGRRAVADRADRPERPSAESAESPGTAESPVSAEPSEPSAPASSTGPAAPADFTESTEPAESAGTERPAEALEAPAGPPPAERASRPRRRRTVTVLVVAGVLVVGAGAYAVLNGTEEQAPSGPAAVDAGAMFALDPAARTDGRTQVVSGVATVGNTVVAIGSDQVRGMFLTSADAGRSWKLGSVRAADGDEPPPAEFPRLIAGGPGAWVALGGPAVPAPASGGPATGPLTGATVWTSKDGRSWTRRPGGAAFGVNDRVSALVRTGSGFAAVGSGPAGAVVWLSADGRAWRRTSAAEVKLTGVVRLNRLAAVGDTLVAQGTVARTATRTVVRRQKKRKVTVTERVDGHWRSVDGGRAWSPVTVPQRLGSYGPADGLVSGAGRFIVTREARRVTGSGKKRKWSRYGVVFGSADGVRWAPMGRLTENDYLKVDRLSGGPSGLAVLVRVAGGRTAVMRSADGRSWRRTTDLTGTAPTDLAVLPVGTVVTGSRGDDGYLSLAGGQGDVDLATIPGAVQPDRAVTALTADGGRLLAVGATNDDAAVWTSRDGRSWSRAGGNELRGDGEQRLSDLAGGAKGLVAVGRDEAGPLVVTSSDGTGWRRAAGLPADFRPSGAAYGPAGYVAVGKAGTAAGSWRTTDLKKWTAGVGDLGGGKWMSDVAAVSAGFVAVGGVLRAENRLPMAWTSADGRKWTPAGPIAVPAGAGWDGLSRVVARGETVVATGPSFVSVSADGGRTWRSRALPGVTALTASESGFVAAGTTGRPGRTDVVLWSSADGWQWRSTRPRGTGLDGRGAQRFSALTVMGDELLAVGVTGDYQGERPTFWRAPVP